MIRLTDEQWERIRDHFPEEHIADGRPALKLDSLFPNVRDTRRVGVFFPEIAQVPVLLDQHSSIRKRARMLKIKLARSRPGPKTKNAPRLKAKGK